MDLSNIPTHVKQILNDPELTMDKKMVAFMAFMPKLPEDPKVDAFLEENLVVGRKIKSLIDQKKIAFGKFDKNFVLDVKVLSPPK
jgi:hypothetical protein|tara:strand:- start:80 stop:334 length:255 start_codon:yes stop_codon:yes gene_type:complete